MMKRTKIIKCSNHHATSMSSKIWTAKFILLKIKPLKKIIFISIKI